MGALGAQVAVHRVQRPPQLAGGLALEGGPECVNAIDADLRVLGLAVPDAPAQALDLRDDHRRRRPSPPGPRPTARRRLASGAAAAWRGGTSRASAAR